MYKNKPYRGNRYERNRRIRRVLLIIVAILAVFFAGGVFQDVSFPNLTDSISSHFHSESKKTDQKSEQKSNSQNNASTGKNTNAEKKESQEGTHTIYLPASSLNETTIQKLITMYKANSINSVAIDLKNEDGTLNYPSKISYLSGASVTTQTANSLPDYVKELNDAGISVIGKISCFDDDTFARICKDAAIITKNGYTWLDYSKERHLNPYSDTAADYISQIIEEAAEMGCKEVILSDFSFPTRGRTSYINFEDQELSKSEILVKRLQEFVDIGTKYNIEVSLYLSEPASNHGIDEDSGQDTASFYKVISHLYVSLSTQSSDGENQLQTTISSITGNTDKLIPIYNDPKTFNTRFTKNNSSDNYYFDTVNNNYSLDGLVS